MKKVLSVMIVITTPTGAIGHQVVEQLSHGVFLEGTTHQLRKQGAPVGEEESRCRQNVVV